MFTSQKKVSSGWTTTPMVNRSGVVFGKGKSVMEALLPPPPQASLGENGGARVAGGGDAEVWRGFREAGLLDDSALQRKDREALAHRVSELEEELHEYQYNMGLLLIEKKDWVSKYEEIRQALVKVDEALKREQAMRVATISEFEKREENLRKALGIEQQCVSDLEKALREMHSELAEVKFTSDKKLDDAHSLEVGLEEKYLEVEQKLHSADAKLAEASYKTSNIDRKLEDVESRERKLQKDYLSFSSERKLHEKDIIEQREHLRDWEEKLQDSQKRLVEVQRFLNERENQANEADRALKQKEAEIEEAQKMIADTKKSLTLKEEDVTIGLSSLSAKEKEADVKIESLEKKEKDLFAREEKLNARDRVVIQKLLDDHHIVLSSKKQEFELDLERRRKSFTEEQEVKMHVVEKKKKEIDCMEDEITKKEQALETNLQKLMGKEKDLDSKFNGLKKWEECIQNDKKKLEKERQQLDSDCEEMLKSKSELENLRDAIESSKEQIIREEKNFRLTKEEREEHVLLQSILKQEIEDCRIMKGSFNRDSEDLRQQRKKFEEEWLVLDAKGLALEAEIKKFNDERVKFEKWRCNEEEMLKNKVLVARANSERELEELSQKKEAFEKTMEHERLVALEALKRERADIARELELRKHELEMAMQKRQEDLEKKLLDREIEFQKKRDVELNQMKSLSSLNESKSQKLKLAQDRLEKEKEELSSHRKRLEVDRLEIQKDIDALGMLSRNLKDQREEFMKEKEHFLAQAERKTCKGCGLLLGDSEIFDTGDEGNIQLSDLGFEEHLNAKNSETSGKAKVLPPVVSGDRTSWLQKCSRHFDISPRKIEVNSSEHPVDNLIPFGTKLKREALGGDVSLKPATSYGVAYSSNSQRVQSDSGIGEPEPSFEDIIGIMKTQMDNYVREALDKQVMPSSDQSEREGYAPAESDTQPESLKQRQSQPRRKGRPKAVRRTNTVKAVVKDAEALLGEKSDGKNHGPHKREAKNNMKETSVGQKRHLAQTSGMTASELDGEDSEACSESISFRGHHKRRQISAPATQIPGEKRYNFRRSTIARTTTAAQTISDQSKELKTGFHQQSSGNEIPKESGDEGASRPAVEPLSEVAISMKARKLQNTTAESITDFHKLSLQKLVQFEIEGAHAQSESNDEIVEKFSDQSGEDGLVGDATAGAGPATPTGECSEEDGDEDEEDYEKHNASLVKKLWTFFTT